MTQLRYICALLFPKYIEPVITGECTREQTSKLYAKINVQIKLLMHSLVTRSMSSCEWEEKYLIALPSLNVSSSIVPKRQEMLHCTNVSYLAKIELPYFSQFLVIASFLASYNPARFDSRFYCKSREATKKIRENNGKVKKVINYFACFSSLYLTLN